MKFTPSRLAATFIPFAALVSAAAASATTVQENPGGPVFTPGQPCTTQSCGPTPRPVVTQPQPQPINVDVRNINGNDNRNVNGNDNRNDNRNDNSNLNLNSNILNADSRSSAAASSAASSSSIAAGGAGGAGGQGGAGGAGGQGGAGGTGTGGDAVANGTVNANPTFTSRNNTVVLPGATVATAAAAAAFQCTVVDGWQAAAYVVSFSKSKGRFLEACGDNAVILQGLASGNPTLTAIATRSAPVLSAGVEVVGANYRAGADVRTLEGALFGPAPVAQSSAPVVVSARPPADARIVEVAPAANAQQQQQQPRRAVRGLVPNPGQ